MCIFKPGAKNVNFLLHNIWWCFCNLLRFKSVEIKKFLHTQFSHFQYIMQKIVTFETLQHVIRQAYFNIPQNCLCQNICRRWKRNYAIFLCVHNSLLKHKDKQYSVPSRTCFCCYTLFHQNNKTTQRKMIIPMVYKYVKLRTILKRKHSSVF